MSADQARAFAQHHSSNEFLLALETHRAAYVHCLPEKVEAIETLWHAFARDGDPYVLDELEQVAHNLSGTAGTFGLKELSYKARVLELLLQEMLELNPRPADRALVMVAITSIRNLVNRECAALEERQS
jgi:HPt (histidine-containing phosphotransfer) domain-containing protein